MIRTTCHIIYKDTRLVLRCMGLAHTVLLGWLLIFIFSLAQDPASPISGQYIAAIFWMASTFCLILSSAMIYAFEESNDTRTALTLIPAPTQAIWLGKTCVCFGMLCIAQVFFALALMIFLQAPLINMTAYSLCAFLAINLGMASLGALLGAMTHKNTAKESFVSLLLFPLLTPLLMAGIRVGSYAFEGTSGQDIDQWFTIILSFDGIFIACALVLFPYIFSD